VIDPALASLTPKSTRDRFVSSVEDNRIASLPKSSKTTEATSATVGVAAVAPTPKQRQGERAARPVRAALITPAKSVV
jgi:hypothetical protein